MVNCPFTFIAENTRPFCCAENPSASEKSRNAPSIGRMPDRRSACEFGPRTTGHPATKIGQQFLRVIFVDVHFVLLPQSGRLTISQASPSPPDKIASVALAASDRSCPNSASCSSAKIRSVISLALMRTFKAELLRAAYAATAATPASLTTLRLPFFGDYTAKRDDLTTRAAAAHWHQGGRLKRCLDQLGPGRRLVFCQARHAIRAHH